MSDQDEIAALERKHPKRFLERSLGADAMRWRELTAPNRAAFMKVLCAMQAAWGDHGGNFKVNSDDLSALEAVAKAFPSDDPPAVQPQRMPDREKIIQSINGVMVSHNGYTSPMLVDRIADAMMALTRPECGMPEDNRCAEDMTLAHNARQAAIEECARHIETTGLRNPDNIARDIRRLAGEGTT
jgi:hypothetical protein